ncbi:MAG: hypothetical protein PUP92_30220 [Rhizonema sp. PD38]|nr:hypothetical protein [Rhizonema sp. PD38]
MQATLIEVINTLGVDFNYTTRSIEGIGGNVAIFIWYGDDEAVKRVDSNVAAITSSIKVSAIVMPAAGCAYAHAEKWIKSSLESPAFLTWEDVKNISVVLI